MELHTVPWTHSQSWLSHSLRFGRFLRENPEDKIGLLVRLKGGGDDDVLPCGQPQPRADLPQVDEELRASAGGVREEKVTLEVDPRLADHLGQKKRSTSTSSSTNKYFVLCWIFSICNSKWKTLKKENTARSFWIVGMEEFCKHTSRGTWEKQTDKEWIRTPGMIRKMKGTIWDKHSRRYQQCCFCPALGTFNHSGIFAPLQFYLTLL